MQKILDTQNTNYLFVCSLIPEFMNSLYKEESLNSTDLKEIRDAFRVKQILGKSELISRIDSLVTKESKILIIGSWIGFTSYCLYKLGFSSITEIDPDSRLTTISTHFNRFNKSFKHITDDVNNINLAEYDCVVNTSCEHILSNKWFNDIREDATIFLQSTDYPSWDHVNTCKTIEEMINKYPLDTILHSETIDLQTYKRFMLIGKKYEL